MLGGGAGRLPSRARDPSWRTIARGLGVSVVTGPGNYRKRTAETLLRQGFGGQACLRRAGSG